MPPGPEGDDPAGVAVGELRRDRRRDVYFHRLQVLRREHVLQVESLPVKAGDSVELNGALAEVLEVKGARARRIRLTPVTGPPGTQSAVKP